MMPNCGATTRLPTSGFVCASAKARAKNAVLAAPATPFRTLRRDCRICVIVHSPSGHRELNRYCCVLECKALLPLGRGEQGVLHLPDEDSTVMPSGHTCPRTNDTSCLPSPSVTNVRTMLESCDNRAKREKRYGNMFHRHAEWPKVADAVINARICIDISGSYAMKVLHTQGLMNTHPGL